MLLAVAVVVALWLIAGALVLKSTRTPSDVVDLVLSSHQEASIVARSHWDTNTVTESLAA